MADTGSAPTSWQMSVRAFSRRTQARLAFVFSLLFLAVVGVAATAFWTFDRSNEYGTVDRSLYRQARAVRTLVAKTPPNDAIATLPRQRGLGIDSYVIDSSGRLLAHDQANFDNGPVIAFALQEPFPTSARIVTTRINGAEMRVLIRGLVLPDGSHGGLLVVRPMADVQGRVNQDGALLVGGVLALEVLVILLAWRLAGLALVPIREISAAVREIGERDLHLRLETDIPPDDELGELVTTFNAMLARLESYVENQRRFTADAAHELRAPLAVIRSQVEVTLRKPRTAAEYRRSHHALLDEVERLSRTADQLLLLARADAGELRSAKAPCDVPDLVEETVGRWRSVAGAKPLDLVADAPPTGVIEADRDLLGRLLDNLMDNAVRHTPAGGRVTLSASNGRGSWTLTVSDTGPGIPPEARRNVFERFFRADSARERGPYGAGLGLSLCSAIAHLHGGSIEMADSGEAGGTRVVVTLPVQTV